ncbi:putative galacturan 1,4-alpha-galacturonidase [Rosa chinensis]|uniref:Putative galacturan 1,4-alpha-galacturonidase n=1 Tax=Rosa chinensis TaxID=74649 RepID=A0A2P6RSD5_ROSCH|nr:putative galacturan 1,4-alpha-galacturonidase [Rosa chinensis]
MDSEKSMFGGAIRPTWPSLLLLLTTMLVLSYQISTMTGLPSWAGSVWGASETAPADPTRSRSCSGFFFGGVGAAPPRRKTVMSIRDFGGVADGTTSNTEAFRKAMRYMQTKQESGGAQLNVPEGRWLTGSFNLTSNFTLFLEEGAVILGSQDPKEWPIIEPLPSYGRGRERLGGRHISLIHGDGLTDVVITGHNGTIDGQGKMWWELWWNRTLEYTRVHPVYCSNVVIKDMTILAPLNAPNTDGIDADSCTNVCIEDCYIESGDDLIAVKSGWDHYGIKMARPSSNIIVRRVSGTTPTCSGVGIGSEMSGGISNVTIEDLHVWNSAAGVRLKSDKGRGGYIENVTISNIKMERVKTPIKFSRGSNDHPDKGWDPKAVPKVKGIFISNIVSLNSTKAPVLQGVEGASYEGICLRNVTILGLAASAAWQCEFVAGFANDVFPTPCPQMQDMGSFNWCQQH